MSRISQDFIASVGYLYEEINIQQEDFLNEESQYYDAEATELVEDIISTVSSIMVCEGYSADGIIGFLADSSEQDIIEKYLSFDDNILTESTVSEDHIEEQFHQLNEFVGAALRIAGAGLKAAKYAKGAKGLAPLTRLGSALKGAGTATSRVAQQGTKASAVVRPALTKGVQKVKDIAKGAKAALPGVAKGALLAGTGVLAGYTGAKLTSGGSGQQDTGKPTPSGTPSLKAKQDYATSKGKYYSSSDGKTYANYNDALAARNSRRGTPGTIPGAPPAPKLPAPSGSGGSGGSGKPATTPAKKPAPAPAKPSGSAMDQWAAANPKLAAAKAERDRTRGTSATTNPLMKDLKANLPAPSSPSKTTATTGFDLAKKGIDLSKKNTQQKQTVSSSYEYDAYDLVLEYLFSNGHVDNLSEAHYVMLEMDEKAVQNIIEEHENLIISEQVSEWVDQLVNEGYDLSEYTWDDIVEYYVTNI